ncbi:IclR family transcriptional regulator [Vreelandella titanicae]|uniref:IclR family transcriptional regulator n=1 Tax=Vreelandella titanicae TaxID=664683 RepID=UPI0003499B96|nr:IclR family transcriptional regulator [Halomonas titanicae]MCE7517802.1 IclR family transcriptional regulator [Halomonas titanicae]NVE89148.1 IclR family transcriptional regulator [Halomonas titanicae]|tara:strand:+ start:2808 stop:3638 length:831 start_codon:yes stop_codon:yes gene_type:complete
MSQQHPVALDRHLEEQASRAGRSSKSNSSLERMLVILDLFSEEVPIWSVEAMCDALGYTRSTAYRYTKELTEAGLLFQVEPRRYGLGSRIIQWDRQLRLTDPLVKATRGIEPELDVFDGEQIWIVCRLFNDQVICVHSHGHLKEPVSYARGTPRPLFMGATSKIILAYLPARQHMRLFLEHQNEVVKGSLGSSWEEFKDVLQTIRRQGYSESHGEVDPNLFGLAAPIFDGNGKVVASLSCVRPQTSYREDQAEKQRQVIMTLANRLTEKLTQLISS